MGYAAIIRGETVDVQDIDLSSDSSEMEFDDDHDSIDEIKFAYCTEFLIQRLREDATENDINTFRRQLNRIGDCVLVVGDLALVKVHVHTNDPGKALQYALALGELVNLKIENMLEQRRENIARKEAAAAKAKPYGMVTVSLGEGFSKIFKDLQVDCIVDGGQTMNPSIEDLSKAIKSVTAGTVFVFPNNGNVILAAQQAAELSEKNVVVIPTKNVAMGIAAIVSFQPEISAEENAQRMEEAAQCVRTGMITYAVRDSEFENMHITEGDIIGLHNGKVEFRADNAHDVAMKLCETIVTPDDGLITVYYGADTKQEDAEALGAEIEEMFPDCDVEVHFGGQPLYYYIIAVE